MSFDIDGEGGLSKERVVFAFILGGVCALMAFDLWIDFSQGGSLAHMLTEGLLLAMSLAGLGLVLRELHASRKARADIEQNLDRTRRDLDRWRNEARKSLEGLSQLIETQFDRWRFTPAEKEIGFLLLKGLSFKEIAQARKTSERTVRQQSLEIYRKSGLSGRAELSAFFLEDLLPPAESKGDGG